MLSQTRFSFENCMYLKSSYCLYRNLIIFSEKNYKKQAQMFYQNIVTRNNLVWKLARGYCLCCCKTFSLLPDSTGCTVFFIEECSTLFVPPKIKHWSKENQLKTFLYIANTCKQQTYKQIQQFCTFTVQKLAESHIMPGANQQAHGCNTSRIYTRISIFKIPKAKSGMPKHKNGKNNMKIYFFFP